MPRLPPLPLLLLEDGSSDPVVWLGLELCPSLVACGPTWSVIVGSEMTELETYVVLGLAPSGAIGAAAAKPAKRAIVATVSFMLITSERFETWRGRMTATRNGRYETNAQQSWICDIAQEETSTAAKERAQDRPGVEANGRGHFNAFI
jgi:hypothetical protein